MLRATKGNGSGGVGGQGAEVSGFRGSGPRTRVEST